MMTEEDAKNKGLSPLCRIVSSACTGVKPEVMGTGPITAIKTAVSYDIMLINHLSFISVSKLLEHVVLIPYHIRYQKLDGI